MRATASTGSGFMIWQTDYPNGQDGIGVAVNPASCAEYANLRPWSSAGGPANYVGQSGATVYIRYRTKYDYQGKAWYMAHDRNRPAGYGSWVFVSSDCGMNPPPPNR